MSPLVLLLVLVAAVVHATWNLIVKRVAVSGPVFVALTSAGSALALLPAGIALAILEPPDWPTFALVGTVSGVLQVVYFLVLQRGYRAGDVSVVYPLARGSGPLIAIVLAVVLLGERPGPIALAGAAAVVAGVAVIGFAGGRPSWSRVRPGVLWGLATGVVIATYTLWDARAVTALAVAPVLLLAGMNAVQALLLAPLALRRPAATRAVLRRHGLEVLAVALLSPASYLLILFALQLAPVSIVAPAREVSVVLVGLAGWLWFREPHPAARLTGAAVVLGGVALLALSR